MKFENVEVCDCECHKEGRSIMHFMACCDLCYQTYLTPEGLNHPREDLPFIEIVSFRKNYYSKKRKIMMEKIEVNDMAWTFSTYDDDFPIDLKLVQIRSISIENGVARLHYVWNGRCSSNTINNFRYFNGEIPNFEGK